MVHPRPHNSHVAALRWGLLTPNLCPVPAPTAGLSNLPPLSDAARSCQACLHSHQQERDSSLFPASPRERAPRSLLSQGLWSGCSRRAHQCSKSSRAGLKSLTWHLTRTGPCPKHRTPSHRATEPQSRRNEGEFQGSYISASRWGTTPPTSQLVTETAVM